MRPLPATPTPPASVPKFTGLGGTLAPIPIAPVHPSIRPSVHPSIPSIPSNDIM